MNKTLFLTVALCLVAASVLAFSPPAAVVKALAATDVTAGFAKKSFEAMLQSLPPEAAAKAAGQGWSFSAPDGSAEFFWAPRPQTPDSPVALLRTPLAPFLDAGLDPEAFPKGSIQDGMLTFAFRTEGATAESAPPPTTPLQAFAALIDAFRDRLAYHFQLEHYGFDLSGGNILEWAGDLTSNELDLVFVLDPAVFLTAGADVRSIAGWSYGTIIVHDPKTGRKTEVAKLLKPFNLQ